MLSCCEPLETIRIKGITIAKLNCLARCNGANSNLHYASNISLQQFRCDVQNTTSNKDDLNIMICSYHRPTLNQTGNGHFSPIGAYDPVTDSVLIMDVARFKYPPHWISLSILYQSMREIDSETGKSRGYLILTAKSDFTYLAGGCDNNCEVSVDDIDTIPSIDKEQKQLALSCLKNSLDHKCDLCSSSS